MPIIMKPQSILRPDEWPDKDVKPNGQYQDTFCLYAPNCEYWKFGLHCPCVNWADNDEW